MSRSLLAVPLLLAALVAACDSGTAPEPPPPPDPATLAVDSVRIESPDTFAVLNQVIRLSATLLASDGTVLSGRPIVWSSSDTTIANVGSDGAVTARRAGAVTISATSETRSGRLALRVFSGSCGFGFSRYLGVGASRRVTVYGPDFGVPVTNLAVSSSNPGVATVSSDGVVTALAEGEATLRVSCANAAPATRAVTVMRGYDATFLGTLGGTLSIPRDLNEAGVVVGEADVGSYTMHAFRWENGRMIDLGTPGVTSRALGISENGLIVGAYTAQSGDTGFRPFLWKEGKVTLLDPDAEEENVVATAVNSAGTIVGYSETRSANITVGSALAWAGGTRTDYGRMGSGWARFARIDEAGRMLAVSQGEPLTGMVSFLVDGDARTAIPFRATGLASNGFVSGDMGFSSAYLWEKGATQVYSLGRHNFLTSLDVNRAGTIVGEAFEMGLPETYAYVWDRTSIIRLAELVVNLPEGLDLRSATGINDRGQIIATGFHGPSGRRGAVLLTPRP